ncbi:MAG: hypothetical protein KGZ43_11265 [Sulfuritalea sp.]|nr:hypothetical protein [Sulfuritalea sp.]
MRWPAWQAGFLYRGTTPPPSSAQLFSLRALRLRRTLQGEMLVAQEDDGQQLLGFIEADRKGGKRLTG